MSFTDPTADALLDRMADVLTGSAVDLTDFASVVRTLLDARFMAREINPLVDAAVARAVGGRVAA